MINEIPKKRLTERLKDWDDNPNMRTDASYYEVENSILNYLTKILNIKKGSVLIYKEYGIPNLFNVETSKLKNDIFEIIQKYEPRLKVEDVVTSSNNIDQFLPKFIIKAKLSSDNSDFNLDSYIDTDRKIEVDLPKDNI